MDKLIFIEKDPLVLIKEHKGEFIIEPSRFVNPFFPLKMEEYGVLEIPEEDKRLIREKKLIRENFFSFEVGAWTSPCYNNHKGLLEQAEKKELIYATPKIGFRLAQYYKEKGINFSVVLNSYNEGDYDAFIKDATEIDPFSPLWLERVLKMVMLFYGKRGISSSFISAQQYKLLEIDLEGVDFEEIIYQLEELLKKVELPSNNFINKALDLSYQGKFLKEKGYKVEEDIILPLDNVQEEYTDMIKKSFYQ